MSHPKTNKSRLLLLYTTTGYQAQAYLSAAQKLNIDILLGTDRCHVLEDPWQDGAMPLRFEEPEKSARLIVDYAKDHPIHAIIPLGDKPTLTASLAGRALGLLHNPPEAVEAARNKFISRQRFQAAGLRVPPFARYSIRTDPRDLLDDLSFPCVLKPLTQSASLGVVRADNAEQFVSAFGQIKAILQSPEIQVLRDKASDQILIEGFIEGREVALGGILEQGRLKILAIFDKPDPLDGPFFEETLYVTPSRLETEIQTEIFQCVEQAVKALGLLHGPVHAELRINHQGPWMLEMAARSIGGLCSRALRFGSGTSLEELIIRQALRMKIESLSHEGPASGVMMIPIPQEGTFQRVDGFDEALQTVGVEDIIITAKENQVLKPAPRGTSYLGFIFARALSASKVEEALREAHQKLRIQIQPALPVV
jgi:biotin carboxylase